LVGATTTEDVFRRAQAGVGVHALCGERWESQHGDRGLLASELADLVPEVIAELLGSGVPQI
jgi:NAD(P)H-hydrate repair Nnr-like enzyme with NAD(P)H-hydrate dehydratase domain